MVLNSLDEEYLRNHIRYVDDFPKEGIRFRDVTPLFEDSKCLQIISNALFELFKDKGITKVVGIESRWFPAAADLARRLGAWLVLARKPWKLPAETIKQQYQKEYGPDTIEINKNAIKPDDVVLIHDDLLATWGTALAAFKLVKQCTNNEVYANFILDIRDEWLRWREFLEENGVPKNNITTVLNAA